MELFGIDLAIYQKDIWQERIKDMRLGHNWDQFSVTDLRLVVLVDAREGDLDHLFCRKVWNDGGCPPALKGTTAILEVNTRRVSSVGFLIGSRNLKQYFVFAFTWTGQNTTLCTRSKPFILLEVWTPKDLYCLATRQARHELVTNRKAMLNNSQVRSDC